MLRSILILLLFSSSILRSQSLYFHQIKAEDGLPSNIVYSVIQDSLGYIWFSTEMGVCRYDGNYFEVFDKEDGLADYENYRIEIDSKQRLWFLSANGELSFIQNQEVFNKQNVLPDIPELAGQFIFSFYEDRNSSEYWFGSSRTGIFRIHFDPRSNKFIQTLHDLPNHSFSKIFQFKGKLYAFGNQSLYTFQPETNTFHLEYKFDGYNVKPRGTIVDSLFYLSYYEEIIVFDLQRNRIDSRLDICEAEIIFMEHHNGMLNIGTRKGAYHYNLKQHRLENIILPDYAISYILKDREKGTWYTTLDNGVFYNPSKNVKVFDQKELITSKRGKRIFEVDNQVYLTSDYLQYWVMDDEHLFPQKLNRANQRSRINKILKVKNDFWYFSDNGTIQVSGNDTNYFHLGGRDFLIEKDTFYAAGFNGIFRFDQTELEKLNLENRKIMSSERRVKSQIFPSAVNSIKKEENQLFFGGDDGFFKLNLRTLEVDTLLFGYRVSYFQTHSDTTIISTKGNGLIYLTEKSQWKLSKKDGLYSNFCGKTFFDNSGSLWVATSKGLNKVTDGKISKFEILPAQNVNDLLIDKKGIGWIACRDQVFQVLMSDSIWTAHPLKSMNIEQLVLNGETMPLKQNLVADYGESNLRISFSSPHFQSPINYKYKLNDGDWTTLERNRLSISSLAPGNHLIEIKGFNLNNRPITVSKLITIKINPPWYETTLFWVLVVITVGVIIYLVIAYRIRQLKKRNTILLEKQTLEKELALSKLANLRVLLNPHFFYNALSSVQQFFYDKTDPNKASSYLSSLTKLMRQILENSFQNEVEIEKEVELARNYLETQRMRLNESFDFQINVKNELLILKDKIPSLITQPFIENAIEHGLNNLTKRKGLLSLNVKAHLEGIKIDIIDNGMGFTKESSKDHRSRAIEITNERLELVSKKVRRKATLTVEENEDGNGVTTSIYLPLPSKIEPL